jgi:hypothetical protein
MITLLIWVLVGVLAILILRWALIQVLPPNIVNVICVILGLVLILVALQRSGVLSGGDPLRL